LIKSNIANVLTAFRIFAVPIFLFYLLIRHDYSMALIVFITASVTDWADGYFARKFNSITNFGIFFDPLADKLLVLSAFYSFLYIDLLNGFIHIWMIIIILIRDISITLLRLFINSKGDYTFITSKVAKLKTFLQLATINFILICLMYSDYFNFNLIYYSMIITTIVTLYTGIHYYYNNAKQLSNIVFNK